MACFVAVQVGAMIFCIGLMIVDSGVTAIFEGFAVWVVGQVIILPVSLLFTPFGLALRLILGKIFERPRMVALTTGVVIGVVGFAFVATSANVEGSTWLSFLPIAIGAGLVGGWTWWRIETSMLETRADLGTDKDHQSAKTFRSR